MLFLLGFGDESKEDEGGQDVESLIQHNVWFINDKYDKGQEEEKSTICFWFFFLQSFVDFELFFCYQDLKL